MVGACVGLRGVGQALVAGVILGGLFALAAALLVVARQVGLRAIVPAMGTGAVTFGLLHVLAGLAALGRRVPLEAIPLSMLAGMVAGGAVGYLTTRSSTAEGDGGSPSRMPVLIGTLFGGVAELIAGLAFADRQVTPALLPAWTLAGAAVGAMIGATVSLASRLHGAYMAYGPGLCLGALAVLLGPT
jgi:hypothetical protein